MRSPLYDLNLIRTNISYLSLPLSVVLPILIMPANPIFGGTQAEIAERQYYHSIDKTDYLNQVAYKGALKQQLISLIPSEFLNDLNHHTTGFNAVFPKQIVAHLKTKYAKITLAMMEKNRDKFREPLDLSTPIETWIKKVLECQEYALEGGDPITDVGMVNRIQAMAAPAAPPFWGPYFKGTYLPQNRVHVPHLESER